MPPLAPGPPVAPPTPTVPVFLLHDGYECAAQGVNLGTDHTTPGECVAEAIADSRCHSLGTIMWSHTFGSSWGCRCCTDHQAGASNQNWDLYQLVTPPLVPPPRPSPLPSTPPPPSPPSPPPPTGSASPSVQISATFTLSGDVSDFDASTQDAIKDAIAQSAAVARGAVSLQIAPASVRVTSTITVANQAAADTTASILATTIFASAGALSAALSTAGVTATVGAIESPPAVADTSTTIAGQAAEQNASNNTSNSSGVTTTLVILATILGMAFLLACAAALMWRQKAKRRAPTATLAAPVPVEMMAPSATSATSAAADAELPDSSEKI